MGAISDQIIKAEKIVLADLEAKKLINNKSNPVEPAGPISQALKDACIEIQIDKIQ